MHGTVVRFHLGHQLEPIHSRHHDIGDDDIRCIVTNPVPPVQTVLRSKHSVAEPFEHLAYVIA
ncbi:hypothetical protein ES708_18115 [subsurface metagenome]